MTEQNGAERSKTEPAERLCELLDERDIKWHRSNGEHGMVIWERDGLTYSAANAWPRNDDTRTKLVLHVSYPTPEQAIAATVGSGYGIEFAESFARPPETMVGECVYDEDGNHVGWVTEASKPSCAACPEMGNPDSYVNHLQSALRWHDEHVPRPTNPKAKCIVLQGRSVPEEVLFVREGGGVTHYLPEDATVGVGTCKLLDNEHGPDMHCSACGDEVDDEYRYFMDSHGYSRCPHCGARIEVSE